MNTASPHKRIRVRHTTAFVAVSCALLLQCLAPPGYMAGSLESGWPVVLCPEGLPAGFLGHHAHHQHDEATGEDLSLDGHCPLGGVLDASAELQALILGTIPHPFVTPRGYYRSATLSRRPDTHPTRAPPSQV